MKNAEKQSKTAHRQTVVGCKETMVSLRNFILRGTDIDDFALSLIMRQPISNNQFTPNFADAHPVFVTRHPRNSVQVSTDRLIEPVFDPEVRQQTLTDLVAPEIAEWVDKHIPQGAFTHLGDIDAWKAHRGLENAPDETRIWFWMASDWWKPAQR